MEYYSYFIALESNLSPEKFIAVNAMINSVSITASESRHESETDEEPSGKRLRRCIASTLQPVKEGSADEEQQEMRTPIRKNGLCYSSQFFDVCLSFFHKQIPKMTVENEIQFNFQGFNKYLFLSEELDWETRNHDVIIVAIY